MRQWSESVQSFYNTPRYNRDLDITWSRCDSQIFIPPANFVCGGYTVFTLSVCVRQSVMFRFLNILKSHCWIFIKPCKLVHICKTNTLDKKVRARG